MTLSAAFQNAYRNDGSPAFRDANTWKVFMGITEENQGDFKDLRDYARAPADEAWVYSCVKRIYKGAESVPLRVYVKDGKDLIPVEDDGDEGGLALQYLLDHINPTGDWNGARFKGYTAAALKLWGASYWAKRRGAYGGRTRELYWLDAPSLRMDSENGQTVDIYHYTPDKGAAVDYQPAEVIPFRDVSLKDPLNPESPLAAARQDMYVQVAAAKHTAALLKNRGVPEGVWTAEPGGEEMVKQDRNVIARVLKSLRGPTNAGKSAVLPYSLRYQQLALHSADAEWIEARKISRMTVCAVLGVPLVLAGDDEKISTYANLRDARKIFWQDTMVPDLDGVSVVINDRLTPEFELNPRQPRLVVRFDYSQIVALQEPFTDEWNAWLNAIYAQAVVPNEFRTHFRIGAPVPWGVHPVPKTAFNLRPDLTGIAGDIPALNPADATQTPPAPVVMELGGIAQPGIPDVGGSMRSFGRRLYRQPAVRAFKEFGGPLDAEGLLGQPVLDAQRVVIEDGLRRRWSAEQIAAALGAKQ